MFSKAPRSPDNYSFWQFKCMVDYFGVMCHAVTSKGIKTPGAKLEFGMKRLPSQRERGKQLTQG